MNVESHFLEAGLIRNATRCLHCGLMAEDGCICGGRADARPIHGLLGMLPGARPRGAW